MLASCVYLCIIPAFSMQSPSVLYLAINLPWSTQRRESILSQAQRFQLNIRIVEAIDGKKLSKEDAAAYSVEYRRRIYHDDLTDNEIACVLSHRKALKQFLDSDADYAVIIEDDAKLAPLFCEGIHELTHHLKGWEIAKLYTSEGKLFPLLPHCPQAPVQPVFPKKILWMAIGYMYTRKGAQALYDSMQRFSEPADVLIARLALAQGIPTIGVEPSLVQIHSLGRQSDIDAPSADKRAPGGPARKYFAHRWLVWRTTFYKFRMRFKMRRLLSRQD